MRRTLVGVLLGCFVIAGCGTDPDEGLESTGAAPAVESLAGLSVSNTYTAATVNLSNADAAVVDGSADVDGIRRLTVTWTVNGERRQSVADDLPALVFPKAWWSDPYLFVFGLECPQVDLELVNDFDSYPVEQVCGGSGSRPVVRRLHSDTGGWTTVSSSLPTGSDGKVFLQAGSGDRAVLEALGRPLMVLDTSSGAVDELGQSSPDETASATEACPLGDKDEFIVASSSAPPAGPPGPDDPVPPDAWYIRDKEASSLVVPPNEVFTDSFHPFGCIPGRGIIGLPRRAVLDILTVREGALAWDTIELPDAGKGKAIRVQSNGSSLIIWVPEGQHLIPWRRVEAEWVQAGNRYDGLDPPDDAIIVGEQILGLVTTYSSNGGTTTVDAL